jgi:hypothetical protein
MPSGQLADLRNVRHKFPYTICYSIFNGSRDKPVGIVTTQPVEGAGIRIPAQASVTSLTRSRPALGSIQLPIRWVPRFLPWGKTAECEGEHSLPSGAEITSGAVPPLPVYGLHGVARDNSPNTQYRTR